MSLPALLAAYERNGVDCLVSLRPHQEAMFHAFMVSLAFMALEVAGELDAKASSRDVQRWRELLRGLTPDFPGDEPWMLLVPDWSKPAFMQSPCHKADEAHYTVFLRSAQELDVLGVSASHEIKPGKLGGLRAAHIEVWVYALVSLHGDAPYMGSGRYNSFRKNGGWAARSQFRLAFERGIGAEFSRDLKTLLQRRDAFLEEASKTGVGRNIRWRLLWLATWSKGTAALPLASIHPLALEVTRRVRLTADGSTNVAIVAKSATSAAMRVADGDSCGVVGDPWVPVVRDSKGDKALNPQTKTGGFSYRRLAPVLFDRGEFSLPLLARPTGIEVHRAGTMVVSALGRGGQKGATDGYLRREVHFPPTAMRRTADDAAMLALRSQSFMQAAADMQGKVLRSALIQFVDGSDDPDWKSPDIGRSIETWVTAFDAAVDEVFFDELLDSVEQQQEDDAALLRWAGCLRGLAQTIFNRAADSLPTRDRSVELARARAMSFLHNATRKRFPALFPAPPPASPDASSNDVNHRINNPAEDIE